MDDQDTRIAAVAAREFHEHGITSTGVDALSRAAGISKRTLYERFGSKDGLIVAAYQTLDLPVFRMSTEPAEAAADTPRGQLDALFVQLEAMIRLPEFRGCPFANASAELSDPDHPAHEIVRRHKQRLRRWVLVRARRAGAADPEAVTRQLMLVYAGAQSQALVERSIRPARDAQALAGQLLDAAISPARGRSPARTTPA